MSDFLLAKNISTPLRPPGSSPLCPLAFHLLRPGKATALRVPGPPSEPAHRGRARQAAPASMQESCVAAHSRARLALEKLSQSLSLKVQTGYHGQLFS
jgi:hypothetical protein